MRHLVASFLLLLGIGLGVALVVSPFDFTSLLAPTGGVMGAAASDFPNQSVEEKAQVSEVFAAWRKARILAELLSGFQRMFGAVLGWFCAIVFEKPGKYYARWIWRLLNQDWDADPLRSPRKRRAA